jgi:hypothetical protein
VERRTAADALPIPLTEYFKHGIGRAGARDHTSGTPVTNLKRSHRLYRLNRGLDRDHDGVACEKG